eukprot:3385401-Prymnesium_polylepis.1
MTGSAPSPMMNFSCWMRCRMLISSATADGLSTCTGRCVRRDSGQRASMGATLTHNRLLSRARGASGLPMGLGAGFVYDAGGARIDATLGAILCDCFDVPSLNSWPGGSAPLDGRWPMLSPKA